MSLEIADTADTSYQRLDWYHTIELVSPVPAWKSLMFVGVNVRPLACKLVTSASGAQPVLTLSYGMGIYK